MNPILSILCTIGAIVAYVIIVFLLSFAYFKALDIGNPDDEYIMMTACIVQFMIAMIIITIYFSGFMGECT